VRRWAWLMGAVLLPALVSGCVFCAGGAAAHSNRRPPARETGGQEIEVLAYYRWNRSDERYLVNVERVERLGVGTYRITFARPFRNEQYVALASNTAGFVRLTKNRKDSIVLMSYDHLGRLEDAEVSFLARGR